MIGTFQLFTDHGTEPRFNEVDIFFASGIEKSFIKQEIVTPAQRIGSEIIAAGIETEEGYEMFCKIEPHKTRAYCLAYKPAGL